MWIDDIRPAPDGYIWVKSVNAAKNAIAEANAKFVDSCRQGLPNENLLIDLISLDHDAGEYVSDGGDYIKLLNWLEWLYQGQGTYTQFKLHSMNPVGVQNMRAIIERNGWEEVK